MKKFINKILDVPKLIQRVWLLLWLLLIILLVMKFCFGIWYPIVIENEWFLKLNDLIKISWIKYLILSIFYLINANLLYLISCTKKKYINITEFTIINALSILSFVIKCFNRNFVIITEILISVIIPIIVLLKTYKNSKKILLVLFPIIAQMIVAIWQLNIYCVRGIDFAIDSEEHILIGIVLQLDYYIFLIITWIGVSYMGLFGFWFFGKDVTALKAAKEKELAKTKPNLEFVSKIDERIAKLEKEGK